MEEQQTLPYIYIQYKGTDLCADINCACGTLTHVDGFFVYEIECEGCGAIYKTPEFIHLERKK